MVNQIKNNVVTIIVWFVALAMMCVCWRMMSRLVTVLERSTVSRPGTECRCMTNSLVCASVVKQGQGNESSLGYKDALEVLRAEQSSWLSIVGCFGIVFGLLVPTGAYLLQRQSLRDERESLQREVATSKQLVEKMLEMEKEERLRQREEQKHVLATMMDDTSRNLSARLAKDLKPLWNFLAASYDRFLVNDGAALENGAFPGWVIVANFIIGLDICFDCLVRAGSASRLVEIVAKYRYCLDATKKSHPDEWSGMIEHLKEKMHPSSEFLAGADYASVIGKDSDTYTWLKTFYSEFAPWKFA